MAPPLLIVGDAPAPSGITGLSRIAGALATQIDAKLKDVCRVATLGYGGPGSRKLNFQQYAIEGMIDFVIPNLPDVWKDWAGDEPGVIFFIWDVSRLGWFSQPDVKCEVPALKSFLKTAKIQRWIYNPVDAVGPHGRLAYPLVQELLGFNRILAYGEFGEKVMRESLGDGRAQARDLSAIPHGIDPHVFYERDRKESRAKFFTLTKAFSMRGRLTGIVDGDILVGTVATNQHRKDWSLWAEVCELFLSRYPKARFWVHTDKLERDLGYSIPTLLVDHGLLDRTAISLGYIEDDAMARAYSACDLTLGIGAGEGFGYPIAESLYCGTPVLHGKYAGAADFSSEPLLIDPICFRTEPGGYEFKRPVFNPLHWADRMESLLGKRVNRPGQLDWDHVWPKFEAWFRRGFASI